MYKLLLLFAIVCFAWYFIKNPIPEVTPVVEPSTVVPVPTPFSGIKYSVDNQPFRVLPFTVTNPEAISLIPNFAEKASSVSIAENNQCTVLTSAGFYTTDNKPIGLFISDGKQYNGFQSNALLNGFFSVSANGNAEIGNQIPEKTSRIALQSGPLLITNRVANTLSIRDDEHARRIVAAQTHESTIGFLALTGEENTFDGPLLADVPKHLREIEKLLGITIAHALNLDGGSASVFIAKGISLTELTPVGSFFCVR